MNIPPTPSQLAQVRAALECARIKLSRYREHQGSTYIGGMAAEYDATVELIDEALDQLQSEKPKLWKLNAAGELRERTEAWWRANMRQASVIDAITVAGDGAVRVHWHDPEEDGTFSINLSVLYGPPPSPTDHERRAGDGEAGGEAE